MYKLNQREKQKTRDVPSKTCNNFNFYCRDNLPIRSNKTVKFLVKK